MPTFKISLGQNGTGNCEVEPFNIICKTCTARLKVRKKSLVGQTLACPKCGEMVTVEAPEGWLVESEDNSNIAAVDSENFDDIESLIQREQKKPSQVSARPTPTAAQPVPQGTSSKPPAANPNRSAIDHSDQPLLPNQSWASSESKKRQKLVMMLVAALAGLLLIGAAIAAIITNANSNNEKVADNTQLTENETDSQLDSDVSNPPKTDGSGSENMTDKTGMESQENDNEQTGETENSSTASEPETETTPPDDSSTDNSSNNPQADNNETQSPSQTPLVPKPNDLEDSKQQKDPFLGLELEGEGDNPSTFVDPIFGDSLNSNSIATRMGELNSLLDEHGTTLGEIGSIAEASQDMELVGIPKYFMEKPVSKPVNIAQYLSNDIAGIQYQGGVSLIDFARDMETMIGAPVSLHVESLFAAGLSLNPQLDFKQTDLELSQAIDVVLAEVGMIKVQTELGLVVLAKGWNVSGQKRFATHRMADTSPEGLAKFVRRVRRMFADDAWPKETTAINFEGSELVVTQMPEVSAQIKFFLEKLIAAQALNADPNNEAAKQTLQTRWARSKSARETKTEFRPRPAQSVTRFLRDIEQQANVRILIDWNSIAKEGWTPKTLVPGQFEEQTVEASLAQLARSMSVTYRAVGERTFELLTFPEAAGRPELQIYPASEIVKDSFESSDLMEILQSTVKVDQRLIQISYEDGIAGVVVIAPQSIQRQFEVVMNRLRGIKP